MSNDAVAAHRAVVVLKWVVTVIAGIVALGTLVMGVYSSLFEQREVSGALGSLVMVLLLLVAIGVVWALFMLPLWLIGSWLEKRSPVVEA